MASAPCHVGGRRPFRLDGDDRLSVAPVRVGHRVPGSVRPGYRPAGGRIGAVVADQTLLVARPRPRPVRGSDPALPARARQTSQENGRGRPARRPAAQGTSVSEERQLRTPDDRLRDGSHSGLVRTPGVRREWPPASPPRQQRAAVRAGGSHPEHRLRARWLRPVHVRSPVVPAASLTAKVAQSSLLRIRSQSTRKPKRSARVRTPTGLPSLMTRNASSVSRMWRAADTGSPEPTSDRVGHMCLETGSARSAVPANSAVSKSRSLTEPTTSPSTTGGSALTTGICETPYSRRIS